MKFKLLMLALLFCNVVWASDIIVTKDSEKIEAKITEVSSTDVKYKKSNNLNGPTFTLSVSEIQTIMYENGDVAVFNKEEEKKTSKSLQLYSYDENTTLGFKRINGKKVSSADYADFLKERCTPAFNKFRKGQNLYVCGLTCLIVGVTFEITGAIMGPTDAWGNIGSGFAFTLVGSVATITGVPLLITGAIQRGRSIAIYESECNGKTAMEWNFGFTGNGVGLALNF